MSVVNANLPQLASESSCTGCKLCSYNCKQGAISFISNSFGFLYPSVDYEKCVGCKKCERDCPVISPFSKHKEIATYAAALKDDVKLMDSASGGVFVALAESILACNGVVYGAVMESDSQYILRVVHRRAEKEEQLLKMKKSKYVQSDMDGVFEQISNDLATERVVLFTGTPCQAAAVKKAFPNKEKLLVVDIICHGVPSQQLFSDYLKILQRKGRELVEFNFRSKEAGWGLCATLTTKNLRGKRKTTRIPCQISSYYNMFLHGESYRECCYDCQYATRERCGDITIGDYWGVQKDKVLYDKCMLLGMDAVKGISCVLVISEKGAEYLRNANLSLVESTYEGVAKENCQLYKPSFRSPERTEKLRLYLTNGYSSIEKVFNKRLGFRKFIIIARNYIPPSVRMKMRMLIGK